jgi:hypothetical protein
MNSTATDKLHLARHAFAALSARAADANAVLQTLRACEMRIECNALVNEVANAVYHSAAYDAYERYSSLEEFEHELRSELDEVLPGATENGAPCYVLRPYFNDRELIEHLTGSKVHSLMNLFYWRSELEALGVERYSAPAAAHIAGISDHEIEVLAADYCRRGLKVVNALRTLDTALTSARSRFSRVTPESLGVTEEARASLTRLAELVTLPGLPPTARWFGTDADKINPLPALPDEFICLMAASD